MSPQYWAEWAKWRISRIRKFLDRARFGVAGIAWRDRTDKIGWPAYPERAGSIIENRRNWH